MNSGTGKKCNGSAAAESRRACAETGFPSGNGFMPQVRLNRLIKMAGRTKEGVEKFRLLAARMRKEGKSIREIAYGLCKPYSTVRDWLLRMHVYGPKGRFSRKRRGRKRMLGNADLKRLNRWLDDTPEKHGFKSLSWQFDMILKLIKRELGGGLQLAHAAEGAAQDTLLLQEAQERSAQFSLGRGAGEVQGERPAP